MGLFKWILITYLAGDSSSISRAESVTCMFGSEFKVVFRLTFQIIPCSRRRIEAGCSSSGNCKVHTAFIGLVIKVPLIRFDERELECLSCTNDLEHKTLQIVVTIRQ